MQWEVLTVVVVQSTMLHKLLLALDYNFISTSYNSSTGVNLAPNMRCVKMKELQFLRQLKNLLVQINSLLSFIAWDSSLLERDMQPL